MQAQGNGRQKGEYCSYTDQSFEGFPLQQL